MKAKDLSLEIYDREFFVDFSFKEKEPAKLVGAPAQCKLTVGRPQEMIARSPARSAPPTPTAARPGPCAYPCRV